MAPKKTAGGGSSASKPKQPSSASASPIKTGYLVFYNTVSALAWLLVLSRTISIASSHGTSYVYAGVGELTKWTQTMAVLEIFHSLLGEPFPWPRPHSTRDCSHRI
jgi:very-long-chain (3R)-3-hydroxyacyl-CoA dehydratase